LDRGREGEVIALGGSFIVIMGHSEGHRVAAGGSPGWFVVEGEGRVIVEAIQLTNLLLSVRDI